MKKRKADRGGGSRAGMPLAAGTLVIGILFLLLVNGWVIRGLGVHRDQALDQARREARATATATAETVHRLLAEADSVLRVMRGVALQADDVAGRVRLRGGLERHLVESGILMGLAIRWDDGRALAAGKGPLPGSMDPGGEADDGLRVIGPLSADRVQDVDVLRLIRPFPAAGNSEGGWAIADLHMSPFQDAFARIAGDSQPDATLRLQRGGGVDLIRRDGEPGPVIRDPAARTAAWLVARAGRMLGVPGLGPDTVPATPEDGLPGMLRVRAPVGTDGLTVVLDRPLTAVLRPWGTLALSVGSGLAVATLGGLTGLILLFVWMRRHGQARNQAAARRRTLQKQLKFQQTLMDAIAQPLVVNGADGRIMQCNRAFADLVGQPVSALLGRLPETLVPPEIARTLRAPLEATADEDTPRSEAELSWEDGQGESHTLLVYRVGHGGAGPLPAEAPPMPVPDAEDGEAGVAGLDGLSPVPRPGEPGAPLALPAPDGVVVDGSETEPPMPPGPGRLTVTSFVDITSRKALENDLERSNAELEQFAYVASHDLQEPLRQIGQSLDMLRDAYAPVMNAEAVEHLTYAAASAAHLHALIADLLEFSRVGNHQSTLMPLDTNHALQQALESLAPSIRETGADIRAEVLPPVLGNEPQVICLFQNLVSNGIKYAHPGRTVRIRIGARHADGMVELFVEDNGIGIEKEYMERIFLLFQRLTPGDQRLGTGIGLAMCKKIADRHGGSITVASVPGKGSTFRVTLPMAKGPATDAPGA